MDTDCILSVILPGPARLSLGSLQESNTWLLITACCFDSLCVCVLFMCFLGAQEGLWLVFMEVVPECCTVIVQMLLVAAATAGSTAVIEVESTVVVHRPPRCVVSVKLRAAG